MKNLTKKTQKNKLKIAFLLDSSLDFKGGVQQYILILADYLKQKGHEVHFVVGESDINKNQNVHSLTKNFNVRFNGNKVSTSLPVPASKIKSFLARNKFDIVHVQMPYNPFYIARVIKYLPKSTVIIGTFHILPYGKTAEFFTRILVKMLKPTLKKFDQIICVSSANQQFFSRTFKMPSIVLPNMVNVDEFKPKTTARKSKSEFRILYAGRMTERKGCRYLVLALAKLKHDHPDVNFKIRFAGLGEQIPILQKLVDQNNLNDCVEFSGFLSDEDKIRFMQESNLIVFPAYSGESFGIVLLEGIAAKTVVLAGDNPGYATVLGNIDNALVDVKNTSAFADRIYKIIRRPNLYNEIYKSQQKMINQYDYKVVGDKILKVYLACLDSENS